MSKSRELKDFVSSFAAGYKLSEDAEYKKALIDYYKRKGGVGGSGFSDEDRAAIDPRFAKSGGVFEKLFGKGDKPAFGSAEEEGAARARTDAILHMRSGNAEGYAKAAKNAVTFDKMLKAGEKAAPKPMKGSALPVKSDKVAENDGGGDGGEQNNQTKVAQVEQPEDTQLQTEAPVQMAEVEPDYGSAIPDDMTAFGSKGGMVPTRYAVGGGTMDADVDDGEDDSDEGSEGGGDSSSAPASSAPQPSYFGNMTKQAHGAVVMAANAVKKDLKGAAIAEGDPATVARHVNWLTNKGKFSDAELGELDSKIDPDNSIPKEYKSIARMSAVAKYAKDNPEQGAILAKRLMLTDKFQSQARGAYALEAIKAGKWDDAIKAIEDGYQHNDYDGKVVKASLNDDGSITAKVSEDGKVVDEFQATKPQVIQLATSMANGDEFIRRMAAVATAYDGAAGKGKGKGGGGSGSYEKGTYTSAMEELSTIEGQRKAAAAALDEAKTDEDKKAAQETLDELTKSRDAARKKAFDIGMKAGGKTNEVTHRRNVQKAIEDELKGAKATSVPLKGPSQPLPTGSAIPLPPRRPEEMGGKPPEGTPAPQPQQIGVGDAVGEAVTGKNWTPKDTVQRDDLQAQLTETEGRIAQLESRTHPAMRGQPNPVVDQLKSQAQELKNRIDTYDPQTGAYLKAIQALDRGKPLEEIVGRMKEFKVPQQVIDSVVKYSKREKYPLPPKPDYSGGYRLPDVGLRIGGPGEPAINIGR